MKPNLRLLFDLGHPAHVHLFKNMIKYFINKGYAVKIVVRERENIVGSLLDYYGLKYEELYPNAKGLPRKAITMLKNDLKLLKIAKKFNPDVFVSFLSLYSAHVSAILNKPHIAFYDSEPTFLILKTSIPFTDYIITPEKYQGKLPPKKHIRIKAYKELSYLHPKRFMPDKDVLNLLGEKENEKYVILRFGAFDASHDMGIKGFDYADKVKLAKELSKYAKVFISAEHELSRELERYRITIPPFMMHDALYFAHMLVADTQTSTTEAACLGTPAIRCNKWVGPNDMSNFLELEKEYGLIFNIRDPGVAIEKAIELIQIDDLKEKWKEKREKLLKDKRDTTAFMIWFIENYPQSFEIMKENPEYQERFK